jgi:transcriptional regulator with XRE-family HTH domain
VPLDPVRVRAHRRELGLTVAQAADLARLDAEGWSRLEAARVAEVEDDTAAAIATALRTTVAALSLPGRAGQEPDEASPVAAPPPREPPAAGPDEQVAAGDESPFERALAAAMREGVHEPADLVAVQETLASSQLPRIQFREIPALARAWLDAAATLRTEGVGVTPDRLARWVAGTATGPAREMARTLATRMANAGVTSGGDDWGGGPAPEDCGQVRPRAAKKGGKA